ncbi:uncharacterized protein LOC117620086 isoform X1 [Prunus dulcis]|uniref:uncharacterized protein LOC117620086 isoform X1 n=1 Tax=Prunus dulcis TaxID=3755 RepID=UPI001482646F|nr:uncharacterized protein LOC117620086 isoform X1 [Prunus dulcis]
MQIRNMAEKVPSFQSGGALWFTDLTTPHNLLILPVLTSLTFLITVECNMQEGLEGNPIAQTMKNYSRILAAISVPVMMSFPKVSASCKSLCRHCSVFCLRQLNRTLQLNQDLRYPPFHQRLLTEEYHGLQFSSRDLKVWKIKSRKEINKRRCERTAPTKFMVHRMMESFLLDGYKSVKQWNPFWEKTLLGRSKL